MMMALVCGTVVVIVVLAGSIIASSLKQAPVKDGMSNDNGELSDMINDLHAQIRMLKKEELCVFTQFCNADNQGNHTLAAMYKEESEQLLVLIDRATMILSIAEGRA